MTDETTAEKQKPGMTKTSITIEKDLVEWGKDIPGGISLMVRVLLRRVKDGELKIELPTGSVIETEKQDRKPA